MTHEQLQSTLHDLRLQHGYSITDIATYLNISKNTYNKFDKGEGNLTSSSLLNLIHLYRLDIKFIHQQK